MKHFIISEENIVALLSYLQTKPYREVEAAIDFLKRLPPFEIPVGSQKDEKKVVKSAEESKQAQAS